MVHEHVEGQTCAFIARFGRRVKIAEIGGYAGDRKYAGFLVQHRENFVHGNVVMIHDILHDRRIDVAAPRTHHKSLKWRKAH